MMKSSLVMIKKEMKVVKPTNLIHLCPSETILLESADVVTKLGEKSMWFTDFALKIECNDGMVKVSGFIDEVLPLLDSLAKSFADNIKETNSNNISFYFYPLYDHLDLLAKMHAPSALNILRFIISFLSGKSNNNKDCLLVGSFAYDFLDHFEKLPMALKDIHHFPDFLFFMPLTTYVINHQEHKAHLIAYGFDDKITKKRFIDTQHIINKSKNNEHNIIIKHEWQNLLNKTKVDINDHDFGLIIEKCQRHIAIGDVYQIVPSRTFACDIKDPLKAYELLRQFNPSPYMFYMHTKNFTLLGASPETFIKVENNKLSIRPIAGTRRRGFLANGQFDQELDSRNQASLCLDEKELAEHMMLIDLARNDISSVCKYKSRIVKRLLNVDKFSHVMHLVSEIEGDLRNDCHALSAYQASMNMGTLMGAPKIKAASILRQIEKTKRGFYGGAIGYIDAAGDMDTAIIIRSALVQKNIAYVRAGCGVVYDSNIDFEVEETVNKAQSTLKALIMAGES